MQIVPGQHGKGETAPDLLALDEAALRAVTDPWERARLADELAAHLRQRSAVVLGVRRDAVRELVTNLGKGARARVARYLGVTPTRITQLIGSVDRQVVTDAATAGDRAGSEVSA